MTKDNNPKNSDTKIIDISTVDIEEESSNIKDYLESLSINELLEKINNKNVSWRERRIIKKILRKK